MPKINPESPVKSIEMDAFNGQTGDSMDYNKFVFLKDATKLYGEKPLTVAKAKSLLKEAGHEIPSSIKNIDDLQEYLQDENIGRADNTYNWGWWGPTVNILTVPLDESKQAYAPHIEFAKMHLGGDVRGNYTGYKAFYLEDWGDEAPWFTWHLAVRMKPKKGDKDKEIVLDATDDEAYHFDIVEDPSGLLGQPGSSVSYPNIEKLGVNLWW